MSEILKKRAGKKINGLTISDNFKFKTMATVFVLTHAAMIICFICIFHKYLSNFLTANLIKIKAWLSGLPQHVSRVAPKETFFEAFSKINLSSSFF